MSEGWRKIRPTISTIAAKAGVSHSTVSRSLHGHPSIPAATRERIGAIARDLGYRPNVLARGLVTRRSGVVGVVVGEITNPFFPELIERLGHHLSARDRQMMVFHVGSERSVADSIRSLLQYQIDGCIIASASINSQVAQICAEADLPVVLINRVATGSCAAISCDNRDGGRAVAEALIAGGHRRLAFIAGREDTSTSIEREAGFTEALRRHGLDLHAREVGGFTYDGAFSAARRLLAGPRPDAIFAANDIMACGVIDALREANVRVPDHISVVGFDDIAVASWPSYRLTTVSQPIEAMIERAVDYLFRRIDDPMIPPESIYIRGDLIPRASARLG